MEVFATIAGLLGLSGVVGTVLSRYVRPKLTPREELEEVRKDRAEDRVELVALREDFRKLTDYVHELRDHIGQELPPPPPAWPEGLRQ